MKDYDNIYQLYTALKSEREQAKPLWDEIAKYVGISVDVDYQWHKNQSSKSAQLDLRVDDPSPALAVNQFGDYLLGIMWGTGDKALSLVPSREVTDLVDASVVQAWYDFATEQLLRHMNHADAGLNNALRPYAYDQAAFGTSGIGVFINDDFKNNVAENALIFRNYGVDNMCIDEGKSGAVDYVFVTYHWKTNRIVGEFCTKNGVIDKGLVGTLPKVIQDAWGKGDYNQSFPLVFGMLPRTDFDPKLKGKRGTKFRGVWFMDGEGKIFKEEDYKEKPIAVCRQIKVRGEVYGRSSGTMMISSIRMVNYIVGDTVEILEKMARPALGVLNNAVFGDSVLDTSSNGLTVFNQQLASGQNPVFPLMDVGDPSALIQYLIPYLNEKIATAFKIDTLLDFSTAKEMTATESLQRYAIRGKSLAGMLQQQKSELWAHTTRRATSMLLDLGELGINARMFPDIARNLSARGMGARIIPDEVLQIMEFGKPWYEVRFNNEMEKLTRTESVQNLTQVLQAIGAIGSMYPQIIEAVDWYKLLEDINDNLDANNQILIGAKAFKEKLMAAAQQQQAMLAAQAGMMAADAGSKAAQANKNNAEAARV
jgi:hypothetical protein